MRGIVCGGDRLQMSNYIPIIVIFVVLFVLLRNRRAVIARKIIRKRKKEGNREMIELAKRFVGKECLISAFDGNHQFSGIIKEVNESAVLIENAGNIEVINLDFVIRIREYPKSKKGKKKAIIFN